MGFYSRLFVKFQCVFVAALAGCSKSQAPSDLSQANTQSARELPATRPGSSPSGELATPYDPVEVGFGRVEIELPVGVSLSGFGGGKRRHLCSEPYAHYFKPNTGAKDPIRTRAMVVKRNDGSLMAFVALDIVLVQPHMVEDIYQRYKDRGLERTAIFLGASHSHSGPGGVIQNGFLEFVTSDKFNPTVYGQVMDAIYDSIDQALFEMEPAHLYRMSFEGDKLARNRRNKGGHFDNKVNLIAARSVTGQWLGALLNFAIHGTMYGSETLELSSDVIGIFNEALENYLMKQNGSWGRSPVVVFMNGSEGDVSPNRGLESGVRLTTQVDQVWSRLEPMNPNWTSSIHRVRLGKPHANFKPCIDNKYIDMLPDGVTTLDLSPWFEDYVDVEVLRWGREIMVAWQGEPISEFGISLRDEARRFGQGHLWLMGVTNGYRGYFVTPEEHPKGGYEVCAGFYGQMGGQRYREGIRKALFGHLPGFIAHAMGLSSRDNLDESSFDFSATSVLGVDPLGSTGVR